MAKNSFVVEVTFKVKNWQSWIFWKNSILEKKLENTPKVGLFLVFAKNLVH